ncbi:MAG: hypothetical protein AB1600_06525 [Bacteroidota bacterium]
MKKVFYTLLCLAGIISAVGLNGCKKEDSGTNPPPTDTSVPNDVFPLTASHRFEYSGYFTYQDTDSMIAASATFYNTTWTVVSPNFALSTFFGPLAQVIASKPNGRANAAYIADSTVIAPGAKKWTPVMAYYDSTSGDYYYLTNLGLFFRSSRIKDSANASNVRMDSLRFIKLASPKAGIGGTFTCFEENFVSYANPTAPTTINLKITGTWEAKQDITVNGMTFTTYYLKISRVASVGGQAVSSGTTAKIWLAKGIGPVKMHLYGDVETPGNYRELKSKNF